MQLFSRKIPKKIAFFQKSPENGAQIRVATPHQVRTRCAPDAHRVPWPAAHLPIPIPQNPAPPLAMLAEEPHDKHRPHHYREACGNGAPQVGQRVLDAAK